MDRLSLNECVSSARKRVTDLAAAILSASADVLEASIQIHSLRQRLDVPEQDEDFEAFSLVVSETDTLPIGSQRQFWAEDALARKEPEMAHAREWALSVVEHACCNLIERF